VKNEAMGYLKEALTLSSKIFTGMTLLNLAISAFTGNFDEAGEYILHNLVTIVVCVTSLVIVNKLKMKLWQKLLLSYAVIISILQGYTWLTGQLFGELPPGAHLGAFISQSIIFVIIGMASGVGIYIKSKKGQNDEQTEG